MEIVLKEIYLWLYNGRLSILNITFSQIIDIFFMCTRQVSSVSSLNSKSYQDKTILSGTDDFYSRCMFWMTHLNKIVILEIVLFYDPVTFEDCNIILFGMNKFRLLKLRKEIICNTILPFWFIYLFKLRKIGYGIRLKTFKVIKF